MSNLWSPRRLRSPLFFAFSAISIFLIVLLSASVAQQSSSTQETPSPQPTAKHTTVVNVNEVSLNLVVRDKKGKLVPDLKPEDIAVTDGDVPVKISTLHLVSGKTGEHLITLLFDQMDSSASTNARDIAGKMLKMVPEEGFWFSVMKAQTRLMLYQGFSDNRQHLMDAINYATDDEKAKEASAVESAEKELISIAHTGVDSSGARISAEQRANAQVLFAALQESQRASQELHTQPGLTGLLALSRAERTVQGRKTIIYFTQGLHADTSSETRVRDVIGAANRAGVSIYVIDANALTGQIDQNLMAMMAIGNQRSAMAQNGPAPTTTTGAGGTPQSVPQPPPGLAPMVSNQLERYEGADPNGHKNPLVGLAENTGGAYVPSGDSMKKPLRRMIEDMTTYYEASYTSPVENYDGQFRPIEIKPLRAGLKISSRAGYFALPPDSGQTIRPFEAPLLKVLTEAQLPSDVPFRAQVLRLGDLPTGNENSLVVEVPIGELQSQNDPNSNLYAVHISIAVQIKNKAGEVVEHFGEDIPRHGSLSAKDSQPLFITMQRHFAEEPGEYTLEAAVLDQNSGKLGAQRVPFQIARSGNGPSLSDISMVRRIDPVPQEADPSEPMRYGTGKVVPGLSNGLPKGTKELSFFFVIHPDPNSTDAARLEMEVLKSGEPIAQVPLTVRKTTGPVSIPYLTSIQTATLPPGQYQVIERLTQGSKTSEQAVAFQIEGPAGVTVASATPAPLTKEDAEPLADTGMKLPDSETPGHEGLVIKALPADQSTAPSPQQIDAMIAAARKRALEYGKTLPNFLCIEMTNRSVDASGNGRWKHRDSLAELLSYHDNKESRTTLEINGKRSSLKRADMNSSWPLSVGEFGAMLNLVFQPSSKTEFEWKEAAALGDGSGTVQVFNYRVDRKNATIVLTEGNEDAAVGFHGQVYLDPSTGGVRRVTLEADGIPHSFAVHAASMTVDYDFVGISGRDYFLPVRSSVRLEKGHHKIELNEITFRSYRRFASRTRIKMIH